MSILTPTRRIRAIHEVDIDRLEAAGIKCVLFDRDNTVVPRDTGEAPAEALAWLDEVRQRGMSICMVSNNFHTTQVEASAEALGCDVVHHAMKPAPFAVWAALKKMGATKDEAVLIGDQVFTDVMAANFAGIRSILVEPQSSEDLWYTQIFRKFERAIGARDDSFAASDSTSAKN